jgi:hypothetical protein
MFLAPKQTGSVELFSPSFASYPFFTASSHVNESKKAMSIDKVTML